MKRSASESGPKFEKARPSTKTEQIHSRLRYMALRKNVFGFSRRLSESPISSYWVTGVQCLTLGIKNIQRQCVKHVQNKSKHNLTTWKS